MAGPTPEQRQQLDVLDALALLADVDQELQATATRMANRARTNAEADDVRSLIRSRATVRTIRDAVARLHQDCRVELKHKEAT